MERRTLFRSWSLVLSVAVLVAGLFGPTPASAETFEEEIERLVPSRNVEVTYDPEDRRDPFRSLLEGTGSDLVRPDGIAGMAIGEITLVGILELPTSNKGIFEGTDGLSYLLGPGDPVFDGKVIRVTDTEVIFERELRDIQRRVKEKEEVVVELHT